MFPSTLRKCLLTLLVCVTYLTTYGQNITPAESDLIGKAQSLFDKADYQQALPLYAQLVSVHPENPEYNYKFGVCTLYGDRTDHRRPIRYLNNALKSMGDNPQLNYYLGIAYYQNQEFANAMKFLNLYLAKLGPDATDRPVILELVNSCLNGMNLEHKNIISDYVSKSEFQKDNFHRAYRADEFSGMLILKPEIFITQEEKKSGEVSYVYISEPREQMFYAGFESKSVQRDIFMVEMKENGDWGTPVRLPDVVNTPFDENYPVAINNGLTLYFSSRGHNSLGGYDIYKTNYDTVSKTFSVPENLGVGINSPFDDILFIPDKTGQFAYFSSDRDNLNNSINVYKIRVIETALEQNQFLAENVIEAKLGQQNQAVAMNQPAPQKTAEETAKTSPKPVAKAQNTDLTPAQRAAMLIDERNLVNKMADTSYMLVTNTKNLIRDLTNKRDRANAVAINKQEAAKTLEVKFEELTSSMLSVTSKVEFEKMLENAVNLKKEIYQYRRRSDQANLIARNIGKHIKIKNEELQLFKTGAGKVQTNSVSGKIEETKIAYIELMNSFNLGDTLTDYTEQLVSITSDEQLYETPAVELAFATDMKKAFENNTLLALKNQQNQKPQIKEDIPIVVVDNRNFFNENKPEIKPTFTATPLVSQVVVDKGEFAQNFIDENSLEINFMVDAIDPVKQVQQVQYGLAFLIPVDEKELELNFAADRAEALPLVEPVIFAATKKDFIDEKYLEVNFSADVINPLKQVEQVSPVFAFSEIKIDEEELLVSRFTDLIRPVDLVEQVAYQPVIPEYLLRDETIDVNLKSDAIQPLAQVEEVTYTSAGKIIVDEKELEISRTFDQITPQGMVVQVPVDFSNRDNVFVEENLEINVAMDALKALDLIKQVNFDINSYAITDETDEELEIRLEEEMLKAYQLVEPVGLTHNISSDPETDEILDIRTEPEIKPTVPIYKQAEPVAFVRESFAMISLDREELEIVIEPDQPVVATLVTPVHLPAGFADRINIANEQIEISEDRATVEVYALVTPVTTEKYSGLNIPEEILEIRQESQSFRAVKPVPQVDPVYLSKLDLAFGIPEEPELEIRISREEFVQMNQAEQVEFVYVPERSGINVEVEESDVVINFRVDSPIQSDLMASSDNTVASIKRDPSVKSIPALQKNIYYFRESVSLAREIENSKTDIEVLRIALTNPDDLEYEELLYAASLTSNPDDKLKIYNTAFIHIDRDWRAFNNAGVTSINSRNIDQAECYLYQASLLSQNNGKILNNMGILACFKNDFEQARDYFVKAGKLGINAEYNLEVLKLMTQTNTLTTEQLHQEIGEHRYFEVLGDAMNYEGTR